MPKVYENQGFYMRPMAFTQAETYYSIGKSLIDKLSSKKVSNESIWKMEPAIVNLAFSCEITLKLFYDLEKEKMAYGHKLYSDLYANLSTKLQEIILNLTLDLMNKKYNFKEKYTKNDFIENLKVCDDVFTRERYAFEYVPGTKSESVLPCFMIVFSSILLLLAKEMGLDKPVALSPERIERVNNTKKKQS